MPMYEAGTTPIALCRDCADCCQLLLDYHSGAGHQAAGRQPFAPTDPRPPCNWKPQVSITLLGELGGPNNRMGAGVPPALAPAPKNDAAPQHALHMLQLAVPVVHHMFDSSGKLQLLACARASNTWQGPGLQLQIAWHINCRDVARARTLHHMQNN
jgi:hypothetical protein